MTEPDLGPIAARYSRRAEAFDALLAGVAPDRWTWPSPCAEWDARGIVNHVVGMHAAMLAPVGRSLSPAPSVTEDPLAAFRSARADVERLLHDPAVAGTEVNTPVGPTTYAGHVDTVISEDLVVHAWDLARATGQDDTIDSAELERLWLAAQDIPEIMRTPDAFGPGIVVYGPVIPVPDSASLQDRILGLLGRDPRFVPGPSASMG